MAFREVRVFEVREVLRLWLRGEGLRAISRLAGMDRKTVRRYVEAAEELGLDRAGDEDQLTDECWSVRWLSGCGRIGPTVGARPAGCSMRTGPAREVVEDEGLTVVKAHELLERQGVVVPARTLHRYALEELGVGRSVRGSTVRVAMVSRVMSCRSTSASSAGSRIRRPAGSGTVGVGVHAGGVAVQLRVAHPPPDLDDVIAGFEAAWVFFGGVFATVIPDNMKTIVDGADPLEPRLNQAFVEYAQARGFVIDPARVRSPQDKPRVERVVPYVRNSFFAGETFIDSLTRSAGSSCGARERAGMRVHGTTQLRPASTSASRSNRCCPGADRAL
jgi:hypothetical protein